jgi:hypothetical protein
MLLQLKFLKSYFTFVVLGIKPRASQIRQVFYHLYLSCVFFLNKSLLVMNIYNKTYFKCIDEF